MRVKFLFVFCVLIVVLTGCTGKKEVSVDKLEVEKAIEEKFGVDVVVDKAYYVPEHVYHTTILDVKNSHSHERDGEIISDYIEGYGHIVGMYSDSYNRGEEEVKFNFNISEPDDYSTVTSVELLMRLGDD